MAEPSLGRLRNVDVFTPRVCNGAPYSKRRVDTRRRRVGASCCKAEERGRSGRESKTGCWRQDGRILFVIYRASSIGRHLQHVHVVHVEGDKEKCKPHIMAAIWPTNPHNSYNPSSARSWRSTLTAQFDLILHPRAALEMTIRVIAVRR